MANTTRFQKLTLATAVATILLFAVGGLVRGTGSGLGCSTWPQCYPGRLFPAGTIHSLIEFSHRFLVFVTSILVGFTAFYAWRDHKSSPKILNPAFAAIPLVIGQAVLGGIVVRTDLNPWWVTAHFAVALAFVADVVYLCVQSFLVAGVSTADTTETRGPTAAHGLAGFALFTAGATALLLLVGTYVRAKSAGLAFTDWPLMGGRLVPALGGAATAMFVHRVLAATVFLLVLWLAVRIRAGEPRSRPLVFLSTLALILFIAQILAGAANVLTKLQPWAVVTHVALSVLIWATMVALATVAVETQTDVDVGTEASAETSPGDPPLNAKIRAYFQLTKPRIIVLLLITTVPAMILAQRGMPPLWLIAATLVGGAIAAGSANSINMYLDRDIDQLMRRTRRRPLPSHAVSPMQALGFGFVLGAISFFFLSITVNMVAASLALSAIAFYVFVYTMWLKRSTAQNIVIGGAAGAVPALVGWAAVTGGLAAPAWVLFAIIFLWTPPHFWALSMRFAGDYAAAGVPMLPVVKGEQETRRQIFLYSLVLFGVTLLLIPVARMGPIYITTAVVLGGIFVYRALVLWQHASPDRSWSLFKYSIWYLAALFGAVALDALLRTSI
jgi:heme o synthase